MKMSSPLALTIQGTLCTACSKLAIEFVLNRIRVTTPMHVTNVTQGPAQSWSLAKGLSTLDLLSPSQKVVNVDLLTRFFLVLARINT